MHTSTLLGKAAWPLMCVSLLLLLWTEILFIFMQNRLSEPYRMASLSNCILSEVNLKGKQPSSLATLGSHDQMAPAWLAHEFEQLHVHDTAIPDPFHQVIKSSKIKYLSQFSPVEIHPERRKVILLGPHDRFNFGDLLFEKVTTKLLRDVAGYKSEDLVIAGMLNRTDMEQLHDGPSNIVSIKDAVHQSQRATLEGRQGPYHIIYLGGECSTTDWQAGMKMFPQPWQLQVAGLSAVDCAYMIPKSHLLPETLRESAGTSSRKFKLPVAVVNSINNGRNHGTPCGEAVREADYVAFRDLPLRIRHKRYQARPDSAVMTSFLFHDVIAKAGSDGEVQAIRTNFTDGYLAVQMKVKTINALGVKNIASTLDELHFKTGLPIVFFRAGSAPMHDSLESIEAIRSHMKSPSCTFSSERLWQVVALIRYSSAVLSTSLHVRIMSFVHARPRVTFCGSKHKAFASIWDATDSTPCVEQLESVVPFIIKSLNTPPWKTYEAQRRAIQKYMEGFKIYSELLNT